MVRSVSQNRIIRDLFSKLTPIYEVLEPAVNWRQGDKWRQLAIAASGLEHPKRVLDACCGTGNLAIQLSQNYGTSCHVIGIDFTPAMVTQAKQHARNLHLHRRVEIKTENVEIMPFPDEFFDAVFICFGLRFVSDIKTVLKECFRVLRPNSPLVILELARPHSPITRFYTNVIREYWFPIWAKMKFGMPSPIAHHMHDSLVHYPDADKLGRMMIRSGFDDVEYQDLNHGIATLHRAFKPELETEE